MGDIKQAGFEPTRGGWHNLCHPWSCSQSVIQIRLQTFDHRVCCSTPFGKYIYIWTCSCCILSSFCIYKLDSEPSYQGEFKPRSDAAVKEKLDAWLLHLPQVLWEIGNSSLLATEVSTWSTLFSLQIFIVIPGRWFSGCFSVCSNASRNPHPKLKCVRSLSTSFAFPHKRCPCVVDNSLAIKACSLFLYWSPEPRTFLRTFPESSVVTITPFGVRCFGNNFVPKDTWRC